MLKGVAEVKSALAKYNSSMKDKMEERVKYAMTDAKVKAKETAPWTDRTGNARISIFGLVDRNPKVITGYLGIGMEYGKYLELSNQGKYRVVWPTIDYLRGRFLRILMGA